MSSILETKLDSSAGSGAVRMHLVGDLMLAGKISEMAVKSGPEWPCSALRDTFSSAALLCGNLELPFSRAGVASTTSSRNEFKCGPELAEVLKHGPWSLLTLANNHCMDWGDEGLSTTGNLLRQLDIATVGAGTNSYEARQPVVLEREGISFGFLAYAKPGNWSAHDRSAGAARLEQKEIVHDVSRLKGSVDHVIVALHWGVEYCPYPAPEAVELAHAVCDAGARVIVGHHPHTLQGVEIYNNTLIAYSLGNFITDTSLDIAPKKEAWQQSHWSGVLQVDFDHDKIVSHDFLPVIIDEDMHTRPATADEAETIRLHLATLSEENALDGSLYYNNAVANIWQREVKAVWRRLRLHGLKGLWEVIRTVKVRHFKMLFGALRNDRHKGDN
jgi:poly-gamma-glutamate synthesis protein (capsule biosynthesis protein)